MKLQVAVTQTTKIVIGPLGSNAYLSSYSMLPRFNQLTEELCKCVRLYNSTKTSRVQEILGVEIIREYQRDSGDWHRNSTVV